MDPSLSSSPRRDDAAPQDEDINQIASQMEWDNEADIGVQSEDDELDIDVESRDEDGPRMGQGAWVGNKLHDPMDPHHFPHRESRSRVNFDPDYHMNPSQVMTMRLIITKHLLYISIDYGYELYDP